jgi:hypothetical protein
MNHDVLVKVQASTAAEVCQHVAIGEEARALLQEELTLQAFLDLLMAHELFPDAARLLAYALPKRDAVWWACLCVRHVAAADTPPADLAALEAAERWVIEPHEANRRTAMQAAEGLAFQTAASWAAVAAFWSNGSMAPPDAPPVTPGEYLTAQAVSGAVMLAAARCAPGVITDTYRTLIVTGMVVAAETRSWPSKQRGRVERKSLEASPRSRAG